MISAPPVRGREPAARRAVIESYLPLVPRIAFRFSNRGEQLEDLVQLARWR